MCVGVNKRARHRRESREAPPSHSRVHGLVGREGRGQDTVLPGVPASPLPQRPVSTLPSCSRGQHACAIPQLTLPRTLFFLNLSCPKNSRAGPSVFPTQPFTRASPSDVLKEGSYWVCFIPSDSTDGARQDSAYFPSSVACAAPLPSALLGVSREMAAPKDSPNGPLSACTGVIFQLSAHPRGL